jgi:hypothetical protein
VSTQERIQKIFRITGLINVSIHTSAQAATSPEQWWADTEDEHRRDSEAPAMRASPFDGHS